MKDEFFKNVRKDLKNYLPEEYGDAVLELKVDDFGLTGIQIKNGAYVLPALNLNPYYEAYVSNGSAIYNELLQEIARAIVGAYADVYVDERTRFDDVRENIFPKITNVKWNTEYLKDKPFHIIAGDLAVSYTVRLDPAKAALWYKDLAYENITNSVQEDYGVTEEELFEVAMKNLEREEYFISPLDKSVFLLTNDKAVYGANMILRSDVLKEIAEQIGDGFVIIPSSVHEIIIVSAEVAKNVAERTAIAKAILGCNDLLKPENVLSDHLYAYKDGKIVAVK